MKISFKILFISILTFFAAPAISFAQQTDSLFILPDSTLIENDSLSIEAAKPKTYDVDTTVFASSKDSLIYLIKDRKMKIYGEGSISYKTTEIKSENIIIDFDKNEIDASGVPSDSIPGTFEGTPVLKEGAEVYDGQSMKYNFKTSQGLISVAKTETEGSFYTGTKIKKVDKETYFIEDGMFTTCDDKDCPHYHFTASKMKVIHKEQLVAEWIYLNFGGVPFPIPIPFGVFPIQAGRRSGIITPAFGSDGELGTYFSHFGYFWAISDYLDLNLTADYYTRGSYKFDSRFRYSKRYQYAGNFSGSYGKFYYGQETDVDYSETEDWRLLWNHNQSITPTSRIDAKLEFISGTNITRTISDINEALRNDVVSNATYFKQWEESGNSLSLSYSRNQNLEKNIIDEVLPNLTFSLSQSYPFKDNVGKQDWYESFGYNYSGQFQNKRNKSDGNLTTRGGIQHNVSASISPKIGYISISPNFHYSESWYNKRVTKSTAIDDSGDYYVKTDDVKEINFVRTFGMGIAASTKFFGMFNINSLGINAVRHTVTPSISYNYSPDFSTAYWGYYDSYIDSAGKTVEYDKFEKEIFTHPSNQEQQSINFSLGNVFEMKTLADPSDTTSKEDKIQLLNLSASMGYNFAAETFKFSDLNLSYRTQVGSLLSFSGSSTLSPYDYDEKNDRIDRYLISNGGGLFRLTNTNFSISLSLAGDKITSTDNKGSGQSSIQQDEYSQQSERSVYSGLYTEKEADFSIPWDISLNYYYSLSRPTPLKETVRSSISGSLNFNLTPKWKFSVTGSYDLQAKEFAAPQIRISRDLHCWTMNFTWNPIGTYRGYTFEIRVKAPQLQDLKITKRDQFYEGK